MSTPLYTFLFFLYLYLFSIDNIIISRVSRYSRYKSQLISVGNIFCYYKGE